MNEEKGQKIALLIRKKVSIFFWKGSIPVIAINENAL